MRRKLLSTKPFSAFFVDDALVHAKEDPITCQPGENLKEVVKLIEISKSGITSVNQDNQLVGLLHLHPATKNS